MLRQDGGGRYYLEFDGVDDRVATAGFALDQPWDRASAVRQTVWTNGRRLLAGSSGAAGVLQQAGASPGLALFDGSVAATNGGAAIGTAAVLFERHAGAGSLLAVNGGVPAAGNAGATAASGLSLGGDSAGTAPGAFHLYGVCVVKAQLGGARQAALLSWLAGKAGVAL